MARCDICGFEQFPADIITYYEGDGTRRFFCTTKHLEQWKAGERPVVDIEVAVEGIEEPPAMVTEAEASEAGRVLETRKEEITKKPAPAKKKPPVKRAPRQSKKK